MTTEEFAVTYKATTMWPGFFEYTRPISTEMADVWDTLLQREMLRHLLWILTELKSVRPDDALAMAHTMFINTTSAGGKPLPLYVSCPACIWLLDMFHEYINGQGIEKRTQLRAIECAKTSLDKNLVDYPDEPLGPFIMGDYTPSYIRNQIHRTVLSVCGPKVNLLKAFTNILQCVDALSGHHEIQHRDSGAAACSSDTSPRVARAQQLKVIKTLRNPFK